MLHAPQKLCGQRAIIGIIAQNQQNGAGPAKGLRVRTPAQHRAGPGNLGTTALGMGIDPVKHGWAPALFAQRRGATRKAARHAPFTMHVERAGRNAAQAPILHS